MSITNWQKSSYSGNASNCVEIAASSGETVLLRESDVPSIVVTVGSAALGGLVRVVQGERLGRT
ncbi:DUF397 domain-containing protein [Streptomyces sp. NPDC017056]|uniref:DUF397 domain-containing protein n=1 Tax=Streptomyces sp. NPDC017056 TaxID=3364973 RepID=UPI0037A5D593